MTDKFYNLVLWTGLNILSSGTCLVSARILEIKWALLPQPSANISSMYRCLRWAHQLYFTCLWLSGWISKITYCRQEEIHCVTCNGIFGIMLMMGLSFEISCIVSDGIFFIHPALVFYSASLRRTLLLFILYSTIFSGWKWNTRELNRSSSVIVVEVIL